MTDYRAEAEKFIGDADDYLDDHRHEVAEEVSVALATAMQANATATLYLAEQQRIANLIAVATAETSIFYEPTEGPFGPVFAAIREGLAL